MEYEYKEFNIPATFCRKNTAFAGSKVVKHGGRVLESSILIFHHLNGKIMKKIILGLCLLSATMLLCASVQAMDEVRVPLKVRAEFHHEYKHVSDVNWTMKDGHYDVRFKKDGTEMMARYEGTGHRIDTREAVAQSAVPEKTVGHLEQKYAGSFSHSYTRINRPWKKDLYMVNVKDSKGKNIPVYVDKNGREHEYSSR